MASRGLPALGRTLKTRPSHNPDQLTLHPRSPFSRHHKLIPLRQTSCIITSSTRQSAIMTSDVRERLPGSMGRQAPACMLTTGLAPSRRANLSSGEI